ncbi:putative lipoprotein with Yx(FWY)xxD motif [Haloactinopolyspora alba]|uniref:Putative lipoprotein with Yx(FWY)xxD motif n=1 Tax=Haloactinopolyspora alba TaxID=648780 RepID=A0A2P8EGB3_9ACTN|nr:hypothetical protein [Haloactinopolyspora alba]PSL08513.1 putative lipoprotein with Yx(FWY)xxD motif [Haloactinopolyspora alba]
MSATSTLSVHSSRPRSRIRSRIRAALASVGLVALLAFAGCGSDDESAGTGDTAGTDDGGSGSPRVELADTPLGEILVDGDGRTLYLFTPDTPEGSPCDAECLANWPPLEGDVEAGEGVDAELLGTFERDDGTVQASYADWPLYYFAGDEASGDLNGQGVNDVWYVVDAEGNPVETPLDEATDSENETEDDSDDGRDSAY